jgi:formylglycine-generating enzyme required for sulfatase activity/serine/threonine protein kinase
MLTPGTIIGQRYRILRPIGSGGMGAVYEVTDERLGRTLALKQMTVTGEKLAQAFEQEARLLAGLSHPTLPQVYDHFSDPLGQFLVMEYIPGPDLLQALTAQQGPFAVEEVLRLADQLLDVLEYLHTQAVPVIHRDIKPANIKVPNGQVKLLDFGLTKGNTDYVSRIHISSVTGYTLKFAPPEQIRGKATGPRSDLFSLAATLYCLLTGEDPPDVPERWDALGDGDPDPLQSASVRNAQVPEAVSAVLLQAMALRYEPRPASAAAMRSALREAAPALWQPGGAGWSNQAINNPASNQGAQGNFGGPVNIYNYNYGQTAAEEQEAARQQAEERQRRETEEQDDPFAELDDLSDAFEQGPEAVRRSRVLSSPAEEEERQRREAEEQDDPFAELDDLSDAFEQGPARRRKAEMPGEMSEITSTPLRPDWRAGRTTRTARRRSATAYLASPMEFQLWLQRGGWRVIALAVLLAAVGLFLAFGPGGDATLEPLPGSIVTEIAPGMTMEFVEVPAGPFLMGSNEDDPDADDDEQPQHELTLPTYYIGKTEVTNAQFRPFVEGDGYTNPAYWSDDGWAWREENNRTQPRYWDDDRWNGDEQPVNGVTWYECMAYARWLSAQTGDDYRLPTEAEWEKAARGTEGLRYPWGNQEPTDELANFADAGGRTTPVGSYPAGASPYGALDMAGNVWEWTSSVYQDYPYDPDDGREDISNPSEKRFSVRGGGWDVQSRNLRASGRLSPVYHYYVVGCRLARHLP